MPSRDPSFLSATRLASLIRGGKLGCLEVLDHYIDRVERLDGRSNAMVEALDGFPEGEVAGPVGDGFDAVWVPNWTEGTVWRVRR